MDYPEYLSLFSGQGEYQVKVHFKGSEGRVDHSAMAASEVINLVDPRTDSFYRKMYFDDHLFDVYKYEIDPINLTLNIKAKSD